MRSEYERVTGLNNISADNLTCIRGQRVVFRGLGFALGAGSALSVEGANGAGKTSLLRMLAGYLAPLSGTICLRSGGSDIFDAEERRGFIGWLGHADAAKPQMSPREMLSFYAKFYRCTARDDVVDVALDTVGLGRAADLPSLYLSAGQKKRLALARLKICARPLWLLDEPLAALDANGKTMLRGLIAAHCAGGGMAIFATHEPLGLDCKTLMLGAA